MLIGGAYSSGAPKGNKNGWKHGMRSKEYLEELAKFKKNGYFEKAIIQS